MPTASSMEKELDKIEEESESDITKVIIALTPFIYEIDSVFRFSIAKNQMGSKIDQLMSELMNSLKFSIRNNTNTFFDNVDPDDVVKFIFDQKFKIGLSKNSITLQEVFFRRGERLKEKLYTNILAKTGYSQPSKDVLNKIIKDTLVNSKKGIAQMVSNELHKAQVKGMIEQGYYDKQKGIEVVYEYRTQRDERVRPSHAQLDGQEYTQSEIDRYGEPSTLSDPNCRCYLLRI